MTVPDNSPVPPTNVRLVVDGEEIPVSCQFAGWDEDVALWQVVDAPEGTFGGMYVEMLPPRTSIVFEV